MSAAHVRETSVFLSNGTDFTCYSFATLFPVNKGISGFFVDNIVQDSFNTIHKNGGHVFPVITGAPAAKSFTTVFQTYSKGGDPGGHIGYTLNVTVEVKPGFLTSQPSWRIIPRSKIIGYIGRHESTEKVKNSSIAPI